MIVKKKMMEKKVWQDKRRPSVKTRASCTSRRSPVESCSNHASFGKVLETLNASWKLVHRENDRKREKREGKSYRAILEDFNEVLLVC